ncbi:SidA/IucD/PvdA family monooxygenase [Pseudonocardia endophytica]|uniref:L-lysine N6-monooxygenase MbtG n=1 Tax=Pseudonocardia endophytica TaxID=401976 RepID=A0A4R1HX13_PSEEN|nr:SidA/IucD/PvdA family monooxygenase [Pseudonocardia endophytica]TCK24579.1 mycobactin lysine-N-oxygenase [Pseudonocardia endophytica]
MNGDIVVVGAGPKAMAVAARATVLRELGYRVPDVTIVEQRSVASNWTFAGGRTTGRQRLGSYPEKDVGYPYESDEFGTDNAEIDRRLYRYSWVTYMIERREYAGWVDRGRPQPRHREWAAYLRWVAARVDHRLVHGRATELDVSGDGWRVAVESGGRRTEVRGETLMLTGPGPAESRFPRDVVVDTHAFFVDGPGDVRRDGHVAVIGGGETSASIVEELVADRFESITVITPDPVVFSRGEGFVENRLFNAPELWASLSADDRRALIQRIDRGVYSTDALERLAAEPGVGHRQGRVVGCVRGDDGVALTLLDGHGVATTVRFDAVVDGAASNRHWFLSALGPTARERLAATVGAAEPTFALIEERIDRHIAVDGLRPRLVLPMLAGYAQGPGFPNLTCLGRLSDRVLRPLVTEPDRTRARPDGHAMTDAGPDAWMVATD